MSAARTPARARHLLFATIVDNRPQDDFPVLELGDPDAADLLAFCSERRIVPLLARAVHSGLVRVSPSFEAQVGAEMTSAVVQRLRCESRLLECAERLEAAGVDFRVLKGLATGSLDYERPVDRQVGDVDVLVSVARLDEVLQVLGALPDWEPAFVTRRWASELEHAFTFSVGGVEVDVHHRLLRRAPGFMVSERDFFADPVEFDMHGRRLLALSDDNRLLHAAGHLVTSPGVMRRWSSHADVLRLSHEGSSSDAFEGHARDLVTLGVGASYAAAGIAEPREAFETSERCCGIEWAYGQDDRSPYREHLLEVMHAPVGFTAKNQLSWIFSGATSPRQRWRKLRSERFSSARAEVDRRQSSTP